MGIDSAPSVENAVETIDHANMMLNKAWQTQVLFTWRWWVELALFIVPWILWVLRIH